MTDNIFPGYFWVMALSFIDVTMTFYQFHLLSKKGTFGPKNELNPLFRMIIGKSPSPLKFLIVGVLAQTVFFLLIKSAKDNLFVMGAISGMLTIVNLTHIYNIKKITTKWNDVKYWEKSKFYFGD